MIDFRSSVLFLIYFSFTVCGYQRYLVDDLEILLIPTRYSIIMIIIFGASFDQNFVHRKMSVLCNSPTSTVLLYKIQQICKH